MICLLCQLPWRDEGLEEKIDLSMGIVRTIRSIRQEYMLNKTKADGKSLTNSSTLMKIATINNSSMSV
jgi:hypothetical protein